MGGFFAGEDGEGRGGGDGGLAGVGVFDVAQEDELALAGLVEDGDATLAADAAEFGDARAAEAHAGFLEGETADAAIDGGAFHVGELRGAEAGFDAIGELFGGEVEDEAFELGGAHTHSVMGSKQEPGGSREREPHSGHR